MTRPSFFLSLSLAMCCGPVSTVFGQTPAGSVALRQSSGQAPLAQTLRPGSGQALGQSSGQATPANPPQGAPPQPPPDTYTYRPEGRRDPFVSLLNRGTEVRPAGKAAEGIANLTVNEIVLKGILKSRGSYLAMVQGPNMKTYVVRAKDRLVDGVIKEITADSLIIVQDVNDPLSVKKQQEIRKTLREL